MKRQEITCSSRVPEPTRLGLNMKAQKNILFASNSEIRFVMKGDSAVLGLRRMPAEGDIRSPGGSGGVSGGLLGSYEISPLVRNDRRN